MPPTSFSPHTCHTISLTIYRQQEQPESLLTCFKIEGRNVSGSYQCGQSWELMWRTHVWTRGAKEDRAQDTKSWWQHSSDALVLPLAALWPTVASWQGQVSSLWLPSKHRRGHMGELGDGRNEKCHFPRCWADHRLWSGFGGQDRHLPYQWRGWCLPLLYIVMFQGMWSDLSLNESKSAFYGNAFPWNCIPWIFLLFNRVNMPSQQLKN